MLFVREGTASSLAEAQAKPIQGFHIELNLRYDKWLLNCPYNSHKNNIGNHHLKELIDILDAYSSTYKKVLILGDFNIQVDQQNTKPFYTSYSLTSLIKQPACYKIHLIPRALT